MNYKSFVGTVLVSATLVILPMSRAAEDGAARYKAKCSGCHGANGEGKHAMKAPALKGTKLEAHQIAQHVTKGEPDAKAPHNKAMSGVSETQAKAIAEFIKTLK